MLYMYCLEKNSYFIQIYYIPGKKNGQTHIPVVYSVIPREAKANHMFNTYVPPARLCIC